MKSVRIRKRAQEMFKKTFLREQFKKKEYLKKQQQQQQENEEKSQHSNRDNSQPNIPEHHKVRVLLGRMWRRRQRTVGTAPVAE